MGQAQRIMDLKGRSRVRSAQLPSPSVQPSAPRVADRTTTHHRHVSEWVQDWFASDTSGREPLIDPMGPIGGAVRTIRVGNWSTAALWVRVSKRIPAAPGTANSTLGVRCALPGR